MRTSSVWLVSYKSGSADSDTFNVRRFGYARHHFDCDTHPHAIGRFTDVVTQQELGVWAHRRDWLGHSGFGDPLSSRLYSLIMPEIIRGKVMKRYWFAPIAFLLLVAIGCEQKAEKDKSANPAKTALESAESAKDDFHKSMEVRLKKLDDEISKLRDKGRDLKGKAQTEWDEKMAALETKRDAARAKLTEVGQASAEAWKDLQKHAQNAWDDLEKAFADASH